MLFENNSEKSFTVNVFTVLCKIVNSSSSSSDVTLFSNVLFISSPSSGVTNLNEYVVNTPTNTATSDVTTNVAIIVIIILPNLLGCFIFVIDVVILKKINGTITINIKFKKISPNGLRMAAFSLNTIPTIAPIIIATKSIIIDL